MKKTLITGLLVLAGTAQAHEVWVQAPTKLTSGSVLKAELAYGDYPYVEKIPEARLKIFAPMEIIRQDGEKQTLIQKGEKLSISIRESIVRWFLLGNSDL